MLAPVEIFAPEVVLLEQRSIRANFWKEPTPPGETFSSAIRAFQLEKCETVGFQINNLKLFRSNDFDCFDSRGSRGFERFEWFATWTLPTSSRLLGPFLVLFVLLSIATEGCPGSFHVSVYPTSHRNEKAALLFFGFLLSVAVISILLFFTVWLYFLQPFSILFNRALHYPYQNSSRAPLRGSNRIHTESTVPQIRHLKLNSSFIGHH